MKSLSLALSPLGADLRSVGTVSLIAILACEGLLPATAWAASEAVLYSFKGGADGGYPAAPLINVGGTFFGTTYGGSGNGSGTVFKVTPVGTESVLYAFKNGTDGGYPVGKLAAVNGALYGVTQYGGNNTCGLGGVHNPHQTAKNRYFVVSAQVG